MLALPSLLALAAALLVTPPGLQTLRAEGLVRANYRGRELPCPAGVLIVAAAVLALAPLAVLSELLGAHHVFEPELRSIAVYVLGVAMLGLADDLLGARPAHRDAAHDADGVAPAAAAPRGWRGHGATVLGGGFSTGALKAAGSLGLAMYVLSDRGWGAGRYVLAVALLVLATNLFNLLDLRPGRSLKVFVLLGIGLTVGTLNARPLAALGLFVAPVLVVGIYDLRERAMLGDTGSNLVGALAGLWLVLALGTTAQAVALALVLAVTVYGEFRSISAWIERTPVVKALDSLGRPSHA